jgi:hypothetical protein
VLRGLFSGRTSRRLPVDGFGRGEIYLRPLAGGAGEQVSREGALGPPRWRRDGRELYFLSENGEVTAVAIDPAAGAGFGRPTPLFATPLSATGWSTFDVDPTGERFVAPTGTPFEALPVTVHVGALRESTAPR